MSEVRPDAAQAGSWFVSGNLSFDTVPGYLEMGRPMFDDGARVLRIDLQGITRSDSAGLALLIEWLKSARRQGKEINFINVPSQMIAMAKVSGLDELLGFPQ